MHKIIKPYEINCQTMMKASQVNADFWCLSCWMTIEMRKQYLPKIYNSDMMKKITNQDA